MTADGKRNWSLQFTFDARTVAPAIDVGNISRPKTARELQGKIFPVIKWIVPGLIVEGLTLFVGKPKIGKSWWVLDTAINVANNHGDVLYLALEDNERRLRSRMEKLIGGNNLWPERFSYQNEWPRLSIGGLIEIKNWLQSHAEPRLVIIDTLKMIRNPKQRGQDSYEADYDALAELRNLANEFRISIIVVHHQRKLDSDDPFDTVSGTLGLTGAADSILILTRDGFGSFVLHGRGRDLPDYEKALTFDYDTCKWTITGNASEARQSAERNVILKALKNGGQPMRPGDIAEATGMKPVNVRYLLGQMVASGEIIKTSYGLYTPHSHLQ